MKNRLVRVIVAITILAFFQLLTVQIFYLKDAHKLREEQFNRLAKAALTQVANRVEEDALRHFVMVDSTSHIYQSEDAVLPSEEDSAEEAGISAIGKRVYPWDSRDTNVSAATENIATRRQQRFIAHYLHTHELLDKMLLKQSFDLQVNNKAQLVDPEHLKIYTSCALEEMGLETPFLIRLFRSDGTMVYPRDTKRAGKDGKQPEATAENSFKQHIFTNSNPQGGRTPYFVVIFPEKSRYMSVYSFAFPAVLSSLILLILCIWVIIIMRRQQKFAEGKAEFTNNMTHELKTPVSSINLAGQMLLDKDIRTKPETMDKAISVINSESKRLMMLIEKVLRFSLMEGRRTKLRPACLDANEIIFNVAEIYTLKAQQSGGNLAMDLQAENTWIMADELHFTNVLFNLMENAVKYRQNQRPLELVLHTLNNKGKMRIIVEDNGIGIPRDSLSKIFEKFYRVPTGNRQNVRGFGLGLAYVKEIIREMGGAVKAESRPDEGTRMIIDLPNCEPSD